jgi:hypothetical protein
VLAREGAHECEPACIPTPQEELEAIPVPGRHYDIPAGQLYQDYLAACRLQGWTAVTRTAFGRAVVKDAGIPRRIRHGRRFYRMRRKP